MNNPTSDPACSPGQQANAPLDLVRLADVLRGSDRPAAAFLAQYRSSTDADVERLLDAARTGDREKVERLAHRIEGASQIIGAEAVGRACHLVAQASGSGDAGALQQALDALLARRQELHDCMAALHPPAGGDSDQVCAGLVFLVVEDHEFQRAMIVRLLGQLGALEVHGFADGASALTAARALRSPALMVMDLAMPDLNGIDVIRIAAQERLPLAVIMNSALAQDMLRWPLQAARAYGGTVLGAVSKPLTAAKLAPLLAQHRHDRPSVGRRPFAPVAAD